MKGRVDLACSCATLLMAAVLTCRAVGPARVAVLEQASDRAGDAMRPARWAAISAAFVSALSPLVDLLARARIAANAITAASLGAGALGGLGLAFDHFGLASLAILFASVGDAVDGEVARRTDTASPSGALFDAAADRYQEFLAFGGLAILFRSNLVLLALVLLALLGSFMVSYGSAKAEAYRVPVPSSMMRRPERAICLCAGVALVPFAQMLGGRFALRSSGQYAPVLVALTIIGIAANVSAVLRLRAIGSRAAFFSDESTTHWGCRAPSTSEFAGSPFVTRGPLGKFGTPDESSHE